MFFSAYCCDLFVVVFRFMKEIDVITKEVARHRSLCGMDKKIILIFNNKTAYNDPVKVGGRYFKLS